MNIREFAADFVVFVFSQDADLGSRIKFNLSNLKYDTYFFSDTEEMQRRINLAPPHVVVIDQAALVGSKEIGLKAILNLVLTICQKMIRWILVNIIHLA